METQRPPQQGEEDAMVPPRFRLKGLDELHAEYVNIIQINHDAYGFNLAFGRVAAPFWTSEDERQELMMQELPIQMVSRHVIAPNALRDFIRVMQQQLEAFERAYGPIPAGGFMPSTENEVRNGG